MEYVTEHMSAERVGYTWSRIRIDLELSNTPLRV